MQKQKYAHVIIDIPAVRIDHSFEYTIPKDLEEKARIGSMAACQFGRARRLGYIIDIVTEPEFKRHVPLSEILDEDPILTPEMIKVARFTSDYYLSPIGDVLRLALPPGRTRRITQNFFTVPDLSQKLAGLDLQKSELDVVKAISDMGGNATKMKLRSRFKNVNINKALNSLQRKRLVLIKTKTSSPKVDVKHELYAKLKKPKHEAIQEVEKNPRAIVQHKVIRALKEGGMPVHKVRSYTNASHATIKALEKQGLIEIKKVSTYREPDFYYPEELPLDLVLSKEQETAVDRINLAIEKERTEVFLLQGVTGSGKTEVYLRTIESVLNKGKTAIALVPEIALTPQTVSRFRARFGNSVAVLHSGLGAGERYDQWRRIENGTYRVVVGARSALWAPIRNLGLIVIDEEHENTYKQDRSPRYHAREVAIERALINNASVILGSATPSVESKYRSDKGEFVPVFLRKRIEERPLPNVEIVDMRQERERGNRGIFSQRLRDSINQVVKKKQKAIIFLNRRGYSNYVMCRECGHVIRCVQCNVSLTYHSDKKTLQCHHCDYLEEVPSKCPVCKGRDLSFYGIGTERVAQEIARIFPEIPVTRMDADTTTRRDSHRKKLIGFKQQQVGILLGTQMIAKGLDFPDVTLVGVVSADTALALPDFRAGERTFQLLMQVAGRAGRGSYPGKVVVQTYSPDTYAIQALTKGQYDEFYRYEISLREALDYPPFSELINILISGSDEGRVQEEAARIERFLRTNVESDYLSGIVDILGPVPAPLSRLRGKYRWHILLKADDALSVKRFLKDNIDYILPKESRGDLGVAIDVDPVSLL